MLGPLVVIQVRRKEIVTPTAILHFNSNPSEQNPTTNSPSEGHSLLQLFKTASMRITQNNKNFAVGWLILRGHSEALAEITCHEITYRGAGTWRRNVSWLISEWEMLQEPWHIGHLTWYFPLPPTPIRLFMTRWATKALFTIAFQLWSASLSFVQDEFQNAGHPQVHQKTNKTAKDLQWTTFGITVYTCWYIIRALAWFPPRYELPSKRWEAAGMPVPVLGISNPASQGGSAQRHSESKVTWAHFVAKLWRWRSFFCSRHVQLLQVGSDAAIVFPILERCTLQVPNKVEVELSVEVHTELILFLVKR